ncbi:MAG: hypothetical protein JWM25_1931, partial [Thermoleophilia bacterium]|nr:hypothetical protein [Thermoleophilia bacterium]
AVRPIRFFDAKPSNTEKTTVHDTLLAGMVGHDSP